MNKEGVVIATISLAGNAGEERLLKTSLTQLSLLKVPVFVTDGGSPEHFVHFLHSLPNFTVLQAPGKGLLSQVKNSLGEALKTGGPLIFYTEPDKEAFFKTGLPKMLKAIETEGTSGLLLASRSAKSFATFPAFQQMTERTINHCCEERIGTRTDYCYGPFLLHRELVAQLDKVRDDIGWGWRPFMFHTAHRLGYKVEAFEDHFFCPEEQREDSAADRLYRMKQLEQNIRGLVMSSG